MACSQWQHGPLRLGQKAVFKELTKPYGNQKQAQQTRCNQSIEIWWKLYTFWWNDSGFCPVPPLFFFTFIFFSKIQVIHVCFNNSDLKLELSILYETFHLLNYCKHRKVSNSLFLKKHIIIIYTMRRISQSIFSEYFILQSKGYKF